MRLVLIFAIVGGGVVSANDALVPEKPTFAKDVAPIFYANCTGCHQPGDIAPMSLISYDEVRPWVKSIQKNVEAGAMPPWHADPEHGSFVNDRSLAPHERDTILKWAKIGAPKGDESDLPQPPTAAASEWKLGEPDLVVTFGKVKVPAEGGDQFRDLIQGYDIDEDQYVRAVEILPGNRKVVHHVIVYQTDMRSGGPEGWLGAWAAGTDPMVFPEGTARVLKKGQKLVGDMHYHPAGTPEEDATRIGLYFVDKDQVEKELINLWILDDDFKIPAGATNHEVKASYTFEQDARILTLTPHMHYRGKDFTFTATYPDGRTETLLSVSNYDFNWQTVYTLNESIPAPAGTRIDCVAHYDNSADNPNNPDPTRDVTFGDESYDEMMIGFLDYVVEQGIRPENADERNTRLLSAWTAEHGNEVFAMELVGDDSDKPPVPFHLPKTGDGKTTVRANGKPITCTVEDIVWSGDSFTCSVVVMPQLKLTVEGTLNAATGELAYVAKGPNGTTFDMVGKPVK